MQRERRVVVNFIYIEMEKIKKLEIGDKDNWGRELTNLEMQFVIFGNKINEIIDHLNYDPVEEAEKWYKSLSPRKRKKMDSLWTDKGMGRGGDRKPYKN